MSRQHTPGPWVVQQTRGNNIYEHRIISPHREIATISTRDYYLEAPDETEKAAAIKADARLIAAAPDLLDACKYVVEYHREPFNGEGELYGLDFVTTCIAAIRKATE